MLLTYRGDPLPFHHLRPSEIPTSDHEVDKLSILRGFRPKSFIWFKIIYFSKNIIYLLHIYYIINFINNQLSGGGRLFTSPTYLYGLQCSSLMFHVPIPLFSFVRLSFGTRHLKIFIYLLHYNYIINF